ncbi:Major facilitator superfamily (MFS) profile domain-containing protein [Caenorhabditis elegans]|uniref:Major facilitator superfamily (MFS) profile domain-containing protein n=1 Tax=Caenorhabditis elegans TaxID=6239 RepID=O61803_CAEEL|nr:Major facilitator superfamily (MFS) profile domain-containing protein [Caenorhabditis elegans]CCD61776.2 Major facilitator superfamily (MFS) profile domain-containing protein [Caenorhabditis elegans]
MNDEKGTTTIPCLQNRQRYIVLAIGTLCIASIASNMTVINFTMICMAKPSELVPTTDQEGTINFSYSNEQKSVIMWAAAVGTLAAAWPFHWFYEKFGARRVFFAAGAFSTISTALMPLAAHIHFNFLVVARFFQGVSFGADFAAIGLIVVNWASLKQHGLFISLLSSFSQISVMFTMPVAGELCESKYGWESVYYGHAAVSGALFVLWAWFYRDNPSKHPQMTETELEKIRRGKGEVKEHEKAPIAKILTNPVMQSVWLSAFGELMMSQFIVMYEPTFLKEVLGFTVNHTGYFVAIPRALHLTFKIISGIASDRISFWTEKSKMRIFNTIALMGSGTFFCVLGYIPKEHAHLSLVALIIIECSTGFICGGFYKCATLVARQHSHFVLSQIQFIKCLSLFIEPLLVFLICTSNTLEEWRIVFLTHGILLIAGNIIFCYFATDRPADFTHTLVEEELPEFLLERERLTEHKA